MNRLSSLPFFLVLSIFAASCSTSRIARVHGLTGEEPVVAAETDNQTESGEALAIAKALPEEGTEPLEGGIQATPPAAAAEMPVMAVASTTAPVEAPVITSHEIEEAPLKVQTPVIETGPVQQVEAQVESKPEAETKVEAPAETEKVAASEFNPSTYFSLFTNPNGDSKTTPDKVEPNVEVKKTAQGQ